MSERSRLRQLSLFSGPEPAAPAADPVVRLDDPDGAARAYAVDPRHNVVLEASAGTGKTSVLVARYVNLLKAGIDPGNVLAMTFTRKAAAEMRERIVHQLREAAGRSEFDRQIWLALRDRVGDIAISTIDAFCLSLIREFPLEAEIDPGFDLADETELPRLTAAALDRTLRILVRLAASDADVSLVLAQLGIARTREGLAVLLDRRLVASAALDRFLARGPRGLTAATVSRTAARALRDTLAGLRDGLAPFLASGPTQHPKYELFRREVHRLIDLDEASESEAAIRWLLERVAGHFLTTEGKARKPGTAIPPFRPEHYPSRTAMKHHRDGLFALAPRVEQVMFAFNRDLNVVLARGVRRMFAIALEQYHQALAERSVLDFSDVLERAVELLRRMDEFSQSRYRLESRYHHVLVDEFQDTSRAQWELVSLLVQAWGEGLGLAANPSIFIVGDRKQSIYRFRDAEVSVLQEAARYIDGLRPQHGSRRSIARSFRARPELLQFVNDVFTEISQPGSSASDFTYDERDRFPIDPAAPGADREPLLGLAVEETSEGCASAVAAEVVRLLRQATVRDKQTGMARPMVPADIGILFRSRTSHREFERELGARGVPTYVYKGLGFFDADEIKDVSALLRYLADPGSPLKTAAFLRSRFIRLSDRGLAALAPELPAVFLGDAPSFAQLDDEDRLVVERARPFVRDWLEHVDRLGPADLLERVLEQSAYACELAGARRRQAWENLKKMRGLVRRMQNRGYATLGRVADHLLSLSAGDESNAVIEAIDAVNLMTVHAAKGLEFPVVFVVNLSKGASAPPRPIRVVVDGAAGAEDPSVSVGPFVSDTDEGERERERHETRRLLYVAMTRARDRLYLASALKDGKFVPGRGSLAEVLPESMKALLAGAPATFREVDTLGWTGVSGREYALRLCRAPVSTSDAVTAEHTGEPSAVLPEDDDFPAPASAPARTRMSVSEWIGEGQPPEGGAAISERVFGILVHRLFAAAGGLTIASGEPAPADLARRLLRDDERLAVADVESVADRAVVAFERARQRPDVQAALDGVDRLYEVPFAMLEDGGRIVVRGAIDCLVRRADGRLTVVEFKTGRPREAHQRQLDLYVRAARQLRTRPEDAGPGDVDGVLLYL